MLELTRTEVDKPVGGGGDLFPEGKWLFNIIKPTTERVKVTPHAELPGFMTSDVNTFNPEKPVPQIPHFLGDAEETSVWLQAVEAVDDDSPDVGSKVFFHSIITADGDVGIHDLENEPNGEGQKIRWKNNLNLFFNLADALGATYDGEVGVAISDDFCSMLQNGDFDNQQVVAEIEHYKLRAGPNKGSMRHRLKGFTAV